MRRLFKFKYPKISIVALIVIIVYFVFTNENIAGFFSNLGNYGYLGIFVAGLLFSFGFTTPIAIALFLVINPENIYFAAVIGGFGALLSDMAIFKIIRFSFIDEFEKLEHTHPIKKLNLIMRKHIKKKIRVYLLYIFAGIIISSPLPDEVGVTMLAGLTHIKTFNLAVLSFFFNSLGIFIMLLI